MAKSVLDLVRQRAGLTPGYDDISGASLEPSQALALLDASPSS